MGTPTVTPAAPAAVAPAAPVAPVSTPAAPVTSTPTPAAPVVSTPSEPQSLGDRIAAGWQKAKDAVNLEDGTIAEPEVTAAETDPELALVDPEVVAPPEEVVPADEDYQLQIEDPGAMAPSEFATWLKEQPEVQKAFDDNPELKNRVFGALRRDEENRELRTYVPDVAAAKTMAKASSAWQTIDNHFLDATTPEGATKFLDHWVREALITDDQGNPKVGADGKYEVHPSLPFILDHIGSNKAKIWGGDIEKTGKLPQALSPVLEGLEKYASLQGDERLQAAVDVLREVMAPSSPAESDIPDNLKPFATSLKAKEKALEEKEQALNRQQREERENANYQSIAKAEEVASQSVQAQLKPILAKSGLSVNAQKWAMRDIGEGIDAALGSKQPDGSWTAGTHEAAAMFQSGYDSICRQPAGEARDKALKRHLMTYTNAVLPPIVKNVLNSETAPVIERQTDKQQKVDAQRKASQTEPRGTSTATVPNPQSMTDAQLRQTIVAEYKAAHGGDDPETSYVIAEGWKRKQAMAAAPRR